MTALQVLGEQLVELSPAQIGRIEMPEDLREAVLFAATLKRGEALRRHMQYIGTLMREADPEPIRKALEEIGRGSRQEALFFQELERLRDGLIAGDDELMEEIAGPISRNGPQAPETVGSQRPEGKRGGRSGQVGPDVVSISPEVFAGVIR